MSAASDADLGELRYHWGSAYSISVTEAGVWRAIRRDNGRTLITPGADSLRVLILADYTAEPVRREGR